MPANKLLICEPNGGKVKVIFLDIDGVLNGWEFSEYVKYNAWNIIHSKKVKDFIRTKLSHYTDIDKKRMKRLSKICKKTGAKIVLSSSWRSSLLNNGERKYDTDSCKLFWNLADKYHIDVIDKTPRLKASHKREDEIRAWLSENETRVENYIILDDEEADLQSFVGNHLIKTSHKDYNGCISYSERKWSGLSKRHVKQAIQILNK